MGNSSLFRDERQPDSAILRWKVVAQMPVCVCLTEDDDELEERLAYWDEADSEEEVWEGI